MSKQNQKEAVYSAVNSVLAEYGMSISETTAVADQLNSNTRSQIVDILVKGFNSGVIELDTQFESPSKLRTYASGLLSNWLRKDKRLNGGTKYVPAKPGSRAGVSDPQIKAMRALLASGHVTDAVDILEIENAIARRMQEIAPAKPQVTVDFSVLPEALRNKFATA